MSATNRRASEPLLDRDRDVARTMGWTRWLFEDRRTGRIVVGQPPNLLMLVFVAATTMRLLRVHRPATAGAVRAAQAGSLFLWALGETLRGVNPFRRLGGLAVVMLVPFRRMVRR